MLVTHSDMNWQTPFPDRDIAVTEYPGDELPHNMIAAPMDRLATDILNWRPRFGSTVYYAGLLKPVEDMGSDTVPMVRTGTVGALYQSGVRVGEQPPQVAHLLDVRSRRGFSGSPCWMETVISGPGQIPVIAADDAPDLDERYNPLHYTHALLGMFIGYVDEWGVGAVLPVEQIREVLNHEEVKSMRDENDERKTKNQKKGPFEEMSAAEPVTESDFLADLTKATRRPDDEPDQEPKRTSE